MPPAQSEMEGGGKETVFYRKKQTDIFHIFVVGQYKCIKNSGKSGTFEVRILCFNVKGPSKPKKKSPHIFVFMPCIQTYSVGFAILRSLCYFPILTVHYGP